MLRVAATGFAKKDAYLVVHVRGAMAQYAAYLVKAIRRPITCTLECLIKLDGLRLSFNYVHIFFTPIPYDSCIYRTFVLNKLALLFGKTENFLHRRLTGQSDVSLLGVRYLKRLHICTVQ